MLLLGYAFFGGTGRGPLSSEQLIAAGIGIGLVTYSMEVLVEVLRGRAGGVVIKRRGTKPEPSQSPSQPPPLPTEEGRGSPSTSGLGGKQETKAQNQPASEADAGRAQWPAKGVWWWAGFVGLGIFGQVRQEGVLVEVGGLMLLPFIGTLAICAWWYSESKRRPRRTVGCRAIGYILFGLGSVSPISAMVCAALPIASGNAHLGQILFPLALCLAFGAALIGASYFLVFERKHEASDKQARTS